jgi:hypothetical protein
MTQMVFRPPCSLRAPWPGAPARQSAPAVRHAPPGPGPAEAAAAMDRLRATAARALSEHVSNDGTCARSHLPWSCDPAHLAESALGAG